MKKIVYYQSIAVLGLLLLGCDKALDVLPDNRAQANSPAAITELLVTAYPQGNYMAFCESMSDNVGENYGAPTDKPENTKPYFWEEPTVREEDSPERYWSSCYTAIATANHALEIIQQLGDTKDYAAQKGEALLARAYAHFMLVNLFSKSYDQASAGTDLGIPYVTEPEKVVFGKYTRGTVQSVYENIEKDILAGLPLITNQAYEVPRYHFNKSAAYAFATRFYLFKREPAKAIEYANLVFPDGNFLSNMRPWLTTYANSTVNEFEALYTRSTDKSNLLLCETNSYWARNYNGYRYSFTSEIFNEIYGSNPTGGDWIYGNRTFVASNIVYFIPKFREHFVRININASIGDGYTILPLFTTEEALLNRAEAYTLLQQYTLAIKDLNVFFSARIANYDPAKHTLTVAKLQQYFQTNNTFGACLQTILDCKRAEFVHEGMRWFDIRRYDFPIQHLTTTGEQFTLAAGDPRRVMQLPQEAAKLAELPLNPR
ncbi:MAG: RagB/SusD family nutrient uptake outer membrane protein [Bacteroidota bacterium]